jgi:hypothetical protein
LFVVLTRLRFRFDHTTFVALLFEHVRLRIRFVFFTLALSGNFVSLLGQSFDPAFQGCRLFGIFGPL